MMASCFSRRQPLTLAGTGGIVAFALALALVRRGVLPAPGPKCSQLFYRKQSGETRCKVIQSEKRGKAWCAEMSWTVAPEIADSAFGELCAMLCACSSKVRSVRVLANAVDILGRHPTLSQRSTSRVKLFPEKSKQRAVSCHGSYCSTKFYIEAPHLPPRPRTL